MIQRIRIVNFRALKNVDVELRPLTVLVGPNDSGKSSFLDAIYLTLKHAGLKNTDHWRHDRENPPKVKIMHGGSSFQGSVEIFRLPSDGIAMESTGTSDQGQAGAPPLQVSGSNLPAVLDYLLRKDRRRFDSIQAALKEKVKGLEEIRIGTPDPQKRTIHLSIENGFEISGEHLSIGVRILLFFITLAHHPNPPAVVLIEEPETGVHPKRLKDIVELLRRLTIGAFGGPQVQVIMSTHSPYLLDQIKPPDDQVLVFRREDDGQRTVAAVDQERLKAFLDEFMLGEVWFNQGEEGLLTANR